MKHSISAGKICRNKLVNPVRLPNLGMNSNRERCLTSQGETVNRFKVMEHKHKFCAVCAVPYFLPLK